MKVHIAYISVGSNLGDRRKTIKKAIEMLGNYPGVMVVDTSRLYKTKPEEVTEQPDFLNGAIKIRTLFSPGKLFKILKEIEQKCGRKKRKRYGPREIDLDILFYDTLILRTKELQIPHPKESRDETCRVEGLEFVKPLSCPKEYYGCLRLCNRRHRTSTLCRTVHLSYYDCIHIDRFVEGLGLWTRLLTHGGIQHKDSVIRLCDL